MIGGPIKQELTMRSILERTSELEIFSHFMPDKNWKLNEVTFSPFRTEKNPSFIIGNKLGYISYKDFGSPDHKGDCFKFVKQLYNLPNLDATLRLIDSEMNLGIVDGSKVRLSEPIKIEKQEISKRTSLIQLIVRKFTQTELDYWKQYYQTIDDLRADNVYSIKKAFLNRSAIPLDELRFGYLYENKYWKIYQPLKEKNKWLSTAPLTLMDGLENIKDCDTAWITKSKKDKMVLRKIYSCVASTQNESLACFSPENVDYLKKNSKKQILLYDSDEVGVHSSQQITEKFGFGYCNVPKKYLAEDIKDFADLAKKHGLKAVEKVLKDKNLI